MNPTPVTRLRIFKAVIYCLFLGLMILTIRAKKNYHMDEISSYGLANHAGGINMSFEQGITYTPAEEPFLDYLTVDKDDRFNYENVITNQELDVHPPLYYLILHTICSVRAGTFSKWYAAFINFFFALMTLFMLRKLVRELTYNDEFLCAAASVIFVMSAGVLSIVSFLRMYVMAMFWVTAATWLFVAEIGKWKYGPRFFAGFFFITVLGALTHYYCIIYTVLLCTVYCIILLAGKRWKPTLGLIVTSALAGYISYCLFPAMKVHMFEGYRGKEALSNLQNTVGEFCLRAYGYFQILNREIFGSSLGFILIGVIFLSVLRHMNRTGSGEKPFLRSVPGKKKKPFFHRNPAKACLIALKHAVILIPCALYFLFVAKSAAYVNARYITPIFAVVMASVFCLIACLTAAPLFKKARQNTGACPFDVLHSYKRVADQ